MRLRLLATGFAMGVGLTLVTSEVASQNQSSKHTPEEMMRLWEKYNLPGKEHHRLEVFVGDWNVTTRYWMNGPDAGPTENQASIKSEMIYGNRFLRSEMKGKIKIDVGDGVEIEVPTEGIGYTGFDRFKQKYVSVWVSSNHTALTTSEGWVDETGRVFTAYGTVDEWLDGRHDVPVRYVDRVVDPDTILSEIHDMSLPDGSTRVVEMEMRRIKSQR